MFVRVSLLCCVVFGNIANNRSYSCVCVSVLFVEKKDDGAIIWNGRGEHRKYSHRNIKENKKKITEKVENPW